MMRFASHGSYLRDNQLRIEYYKTCKTLLRAVRIFIHFLKKFKKQRGKDNDDLGAIKRRFLLWTHH
uniref:Uncharacterized protein n=1 Tax=Setaria italica TaxID=4555 RepID=K4A3I3_SETIT